MTEKETVTVAGVPVTVTVIDGHLAVTVGRFDPSAAGGLLRIGSRSGRAVAGVYIADENGDTAHKPDHRWFFDLHPACPAAPEAGEPAMTAPDAGPDMTGTQRIIERAITETAVEIGDDVVLERGLSGTFADRILAALTGAGAIGRPVRYGPCSEHDLAYDGSDGPARRELTPRERDILCRLIRDALHDQRCADHEDLPEIAHVIDPRGEW